MEVCCTKSTGDAGAGGFLADRATFLPARSGYRRDPFGDFHSDSIAELDFRREDGAHGMYPIVICCALESFARYSRTALFHL